MNPSTIENSRLLAKGNPPDNNRLFGRKPVHPAERFPDSARKAIPARSDQ